LIVAEAQAPFVCPVAPVNAVIVTTAPGAMVMSRPLFIETAKIHPLALTARASRPEKEAAVPTPAATTPVPEPASVIVVLVRMLKARRRLFDESPI
jgi:hypothetical protein